jgi:hypothetical protein
MSFLDYKVLLPKRIWTENTTKEDIVLAVKEYMEPRYPHYRVKGVKNGLAICERRLVEYEKR